MASEALHSPLSSALIDRAPSPAPDDPLWYKDAIIYQAHVKAFFDSNNDGIGDFPGLTRKLDYLQGLGVTCLWLLPFFPSPLKDDGYDIADYRSVHPSYGTLDDFTAFVGAAHDRHIKVLIELVVNHTSDQHPWFQRARHAPAGSPERAFYVWSDTDKKFPETRIIFTDTEKSNWTFDPVARQYYWHRFFSHQPDLNHNNPAVVSAVIDVMKFWLDLGVDALRLDAVPYLCVREGTNNENLPETHAVLKRIRRELDAAYRGRMLLAEANQWPADVRAYFGDGDECHMAFHFPLMPRMFMALQQEDRHAITEILNQTPDIPESCQWALFLRNHDELTLEMVTDEERDYMYSVYADDPQMRLNVGIRRRLAPLVENSRRRVEMLHSLLFALPGTPIIYYGDEIGMGDNIYLGDRNGVRTPMQWSGDRNAGFSRADPARLYAPPIMDPVYGFESINVDAQERYPFSLLTWMKRLIAMRRQHRVFGRGSLEFLYPQNRKILAFLRRDDRETILIVANLSRSLQPAYLDLRQFAGSIPVEMTGLTEFPRITDQPYFLTLGAYAAYWFTLQQKPMQTAPRAAEPADPNAAIADSLPTLLIGVDWQNLLDSATRGVLERQALRPFLQRQRWFASKAREIRHASISDWAPLIHGSQPAFLTVVVVEYTDGWSEAYLVPLALVAADHADRALKESTGAVLARIAGARKGAIVDGMLSDGVCNAIMALVERSTSIPTARGQVRGCETPGRREPSTAPIALHWTRPSSDQSNTVVFGDNKRMLKLFRRLEPSVNPEYELGRYLTERGFSRIPALTGALEYDRPGLEPGTLAVVQEAMTHQGSGWTYTADELRRYFERVPARPAANGAVTPDPADVAPPAFFDSVEHLYLHGAATLGRRTAELHLSLASGSGPVFAPEPCNRTALNALADRMARHADASLSTLAQRVASLSEPSRTHAETVMSRRADLLARFNSIRSLDRAGMLIRVHGDYHLGQVLRTENDFVILDFEGEPARSISERRAKQSPMKDVGGMLRSYSYAAYAGLFTFTTHASDREARLQAWANIWQHWVSNAFLRGYRSAAGNAPFLPRGDAWRTLLCTFMLDKAFYELEYELNHRPDWIRIPLIGIQKLLE